MTAPDQPSQELEEHDAHHPHDGILQGDPDDRVLEQPAVVVEADVLREVGPQDLQPVEAEPDGPGNRIGNDPQEEDQRGRKQKEGQEPPPAPPAFR